MSQELPRLSLRGVDGRRTPLWVPGSHREGVCLTKRPDLDHVPVTHITQRHVRQVGATSHGVDVPMRQISLACQVQGRDAQRIVYDLLDSLGNTGQLVQLETGAGRSMGVIFTGLSEIEWWGDPNHPHGARFEVLLDAPRPVWAGAPMSATFTSANASGLLRIPVDGPRPVYPIIRITGTNSGVSIIHDGAVNTLPSRAGGYRWVTDPAKHSLTGIAGGATIALPGRVPVFRTPLVPQRAGRGREILLSTSIVGMQSNFRLIVDTFGEHNRPWA